MGSFWHLALLGLTLGIAKGQNSTSTYSEPGVPTETPVPGNYAGALRPQVHFSPPHGFMNDPNGMFVDADGVYHLYYQYNPTDLVAGNQHWGHATSRDLYTWENQPIAIYPGAPGEGIFSGSAVVDTNNTSGFFPSQTNGVVAIYTLNTNTTQTQNIAYSTDGGYTFTKYADNPVIPSTSNQFRDPKVLWHAPTQRWVMVVSYAVDFEIGIFTSPNLVNWTAASNFSHHGLLGLQYECPNLVELPMNGSSDPMWLLWISINPGAPLGGSTTQYFPGTFNGTHFTAMDGATRLNDFAKDNYAAQFFSGIPGSQDQVSIAWANNWQYTDVVPTAGEGWRSTMSVPRTNYLTNLTRTGYTLISYPHNISAAIESELAYKSSLGNGTVFVDYSSLSSGALFFQANVTGLTSDSLQGTLNFTFSSSTSGEYLTGGTFISTGDIWLDRGHTLGFNNPFFSDKFSQTGLYQGNGRWSISGVIDRSIIELFLNEGELSGTSVFYPTAPLDRLVIGAKGINETASVSVGVWGLRSGWMGQEDGNGTVIGNATEVTGMKLF